MKKIIEFILLLSVITITFSSCTITKSSKADEKPRTITVSGSGTVSVKPDIISLNFIIKSLDWNIQRAVEKNATNSESVLTALKATGVDSKDISTVDYRITEDNSHDYPGQYTVINTISVIIRNPEIAGKVIDSAVKYNTGANGLVSFKYAVSDKSSALREARTLAIQNAQDAASLLAGASGCKIGKVIDIHENQSQTKLSNDVMLAKSNNNTQIEIGSMFVTSDVTVSYELEN